MGLRFFIINILLLNPVHFYAKIISSKKMYVLARAQNMGRNVLDEIRKSHFCSGFVKFFLPLYNPFNFNKRRQSNNTFCFFFINLVSRNLGYRKFSIEPSMKKKESRISPLQSQCPETLNMQIKIYIPSVAWLQ